MPQRTWHKCSCSSVDGYAHIIFIFVYWLLQSHLVDRFLPLLFADTACLQIYWTEFVVYKTGHIQHSVWGRKFKSSHSVHAIRTVMSFQVSESFDFVIFLGSKRASDNISCGRVCMKLILLWSPSVVAILNYTTAISITRALVHNWLNSRRGITIFQWTNVVFKLSTKSNKLFSFFFFWYLGEYVQRFTLAKKSVPWMCWLSVTDKQ